MHEEKPSRLSNAGQRTKKRATSMAATIAITVLITILMAALSGLNGGFATQDTGSADHSLSWPVTVHLATALPALLLGPIVLFRRKGDQTHRLLGRIWAMLMLTTAIASAFIRSPGMGILGSGFSFIHIFTVWTLVMVPMGVWSARQGRIEVHKEAMKGLYAGLVVAGAFTLIPGRFLGNIAFG